MHHQVATKRKMTKEIDMKKLIFSSLLLGSFTFVSPSFAYDIKNLRDVHNAAAGLYESGHDNNYLEWKILSKNQFQKFSKNKISMAIQSNDSSKEELALKAISECAFFAKGAYGEHLSQAEQSNLSFKLLNNVISNLQGELFRAEGAFLLNDHALYSSSCALGFQVGNDVLVLQGVTVD